MKRYFFVIFLLLSSFYNIHAQQKLTLEDIWSGRFTPDYFYGGQMVEDHNMLYGHFKNGNYTIDLIDLSHPGKEKTLFSTEKNNEFRYVYDYVYTKQLDKFLLMSEIKRVYRYSSFGKYYLYDVASGKLELFTDRYIQIPSFTPDGKRVVYFQENNLYYKDLSSGRIYAITTDGEINKIINGKTDWVYEEEFSFVKAYAVSRDGRYLAYLKFDESEVPEYTLTLYEDRLYPKLYTYKYPKAGQKNSKVGLYIYNFETGQTYSLDLGSYEYIPYLNAGPGDDEFLVMTMNRLQNELKLFSFTGSGKNPVLIGKQADDKYVDFERVKKLFFVDNGHYLWQNESSGYNHVYLYDRSGKILKQITRGQWEVTDFYGYDKQSDRIFYQSTETGSINRAVFSVDLKGRSKVRLSPAEGYAAAEFSKDFRYFVLNYSNSETPPQAVLYAFDAARKKTERLKTFTDNRKLMKKLAEFDLPQKEFIRFTSADGKHELNAYMFRPVHFERNKKYPVLIYQYNGPGVQTVLNAW
jgi:dipeptidyl-peptidase-4